VVSIWSARGTGVASIVALVFALAGCAPATTAREPYTATLIGSTASPWIAAPAGWSDIEAKQSPGGCASSIVFTDANQNVLVRLAPVVIVDAPDGPAARAEASTRLSGMSANLPGGAYRFAGHADPGCAWSVTVTRSSTP
jgi:hypothetical protein